MRSSLTEDPLVPRPKAARLLGCSTRTLKRYEAGGKLKPYKQNSRVVCYLQSQIEKLREEWAAAA